MPLNENPVFIVGIFRSGTSLLCSLLNQNPQIALMYECDVWNFPAPLLQRRFQHNWAARMEFYNQALSRHGLTEPNVYRGLYKIRTPLDLYRAFATKKGATVCGEKSPFYCTRLEQLHREYPRAAFIFIWRNPVEVYRSVLKAGQTSRFFGRAGMLSRLIYTQEQALHQLERIEGQGARIFRVDYASLVDHTEQVCRDLSLFLGVPFSPRMTALKEADMSAIYQAPHHAHLRSGIIGRQHYARELVSPVIAQKLERYRHRWERLQANWLKPATKTPAAEPGPGEMFRDLLTGRALTIYDSLIRTGFEFFPLRWLRVYRLFKHWVVNPPSGATDEKTSLVKDWQTNWRTILVAIGMLGAVAVIQMHSNPHLQFILFYGLPCALIALVVNTRWATLFVVISSVVSQLIRYEGAPEYHSIPVFVWNLLTRLIVLQLLVLTLGRIRLEFSKNGDQVD